MKKSLLILTTIMLGLICFFVACDANTQDTSMPNTKDTSTPSTQDTSIPSTQDTSTPSTQDTSIPSTQDTSTSIHTHDFSDWKTTKAATCTEEGAEERECSCGKKEIAAIPASGHTEVKDEAVPGDCTTPGLSEGSHCGVCNEIILEQTEVEPSHNAPYGVCTSCNKVIDSDLAGDTYISIKSNALNNYFTTYYDGDLFAKYDFYTYDLEVIVSNTYDGKIAISVYLDLTAELVRTSPYYSGTGFVEYEVLMEGIPLESGHASVSSNTVSLSWFTTLNKLTEIEFEVYLDDYYM